MSLVHVFDFGLQLGCPAPSCATTTDRCGSGWEALWLLFGRLRRLEGDTCAMVELGNRVIKSLPPPDREVVADPATLAIYMREALEAFRQGARGAAQDTP